MKSAMKRPASAGVLTLTKPAPKPPRPGTAKLKLLEHPSMLKDGQPIARGKDGVSTFLERLYDKAEDNGDNDLAKAIEVLQDRANKIMFAPKWKPPKRRVFVPRDSEDEDWLMEKAADAFAKAPLKRAATGMPMLSKPTEMDGMISLGPQTRARLGLPASVGAFAR